VTNCDRREFSLEPVGGFVGGKKSSPIERDGEKKKSHRIGLIFGSFVGVRRRKKIGPIRRSKGGAGEKERGARERRLLLELSPKGGPGLGV